jgi:hypothetical protein
MASNARKCCCADACGCIAGTQPTTVTVTLAGVDVTTWLNTVISCGGDTVKITASQDPNSTRTITPSGTPCEWRGGPTSFLTTIVYNTFYGLSDGGPLGFILDKTPGGGWDLEVYKQFVVGFSGETDLRIVFFKGHLSATDPVDCSQTLTFSNGITAGTCTKVGRLLTVYFGSGGSAVLTP